MNALCGHDTHHAGLVMLHPICENAHFLKRRTHRTFYEMANLMFERSAVELKQEVFTLFTYIYTFMISYFGIILQTSSIYCCVFPAKNITDNKSVIFHSLTSSSITSVYFKKNVYCSI